MRPSIENDSGSLAKLNDLLSINKVYAKLNDLSICLNDLILFLRNDYEKVLRKVFIKPH